MERLNETLSLWYFQKGFLHFAKENTSGWVNMETLFNVLHVSCVIIVI